MRHVTVTGLAMAALTTLGTATHLPPHLTKRQEADACRVIEVQCPNASHLPKSDGVSVGRREVNMNDVSNGPFPRVTKSHRLFADIADQEVKGAIATPTMVARDVAAEDGETNVKPKFKGGVPKFATIAKQPPAGTTTRMHPPGQTAYVKGGVPKFTNIDLAKNPPVVMETKTRMHPPGKTAPVKTLDGIRQPPLPKTQLSSLGRKHPRDLMQSTAPVTEVEEKEEVLLLPITASLLLQLPDEILPYAVYYPTTEGSYQFYLYIWSNPNLPAECQESVLACGENNPIKLMDLPESTEPEDADVIELARRALWGVDPVRYELYAPIASVSDKTVERRAEDELVKDLYHLGPIDGKANAFHLVPLKTLPNEAEKNKIIVARNHMPEPPEVVYVDNIVVEQNHTHEPLFRVTTPESSEDKDGDFIKDFYHLDTVDETNNTFRLVPVKASPAAEPHVQTAPSSPAVDETDEETDGIILDKRHTHEPLNALPHFKASPTFEELDKVLDFDHPPQPGELVQNVIHKSGPWASYLDSPQPTSTKKPSPPIYRSTGPPHVQRARKGPPIPRVRGKLDTVNHVEVARTTGDLISFPVHRLFRVVSREKDLLCQFTENEATESKLAVICEVNRDLNPKKLLVIKDKRGQYTCPRLHAESNHPYLCLQDDPFSNLLTRAEASAQWDHVAARVEVDPHEKSFEFSYEDKNVSCNTIDDPHHPNRLAAVCEVENDDKPGENWVFEHLYGYYVCRYPRDPKEPLPSPTAYMCTTVKFPPRLQRRAETDDPLEEDVTVQKPWIGLEEHGKYTCTPDTNGEHVCTFEENAAVTNTTSELARRSLDLTALPSLRQHCQGLRVLMPDIPGLQEHCLDNVSQFDQVQLRKNADATNTTSAQPELFEKQKLSRRNDTLPADDPAMTVPGWVGYDTTKSAEDVCMEMVATTGKQHLVAKCRELGFRYPGPLNRWIEGSEDDAPTLPVLARRGLVSHTNEDIEEACQELVKTNPDLPNLKSRCLSVAKLSLKIGNTSKVVIKQKCKLMSDVRGDPDFEAWCMKEYDDYAAKKELRKRDPWGERVEDEDFMTFCHRMNDQRPEGVKDYGDDCQWMSEQHIVTG